ncbi:MAG TPA: hypothetical protein VG269_17490 [Tepidisphaeraceae bacterium]|jgi:hypothetical protein|nr:hypothetical protein [Tepidisphaeraceae bacterium]
MDKHIQPKQKVIVVMWSEYSELPSIWEGTVTGVDPTNWTEPVSLDVQSRVNPKGFRTKRCKVEEVFQSGAEASEYIIRIARQKIAKLEEIIKNPLAFEK